MEPEELVYETERSNLSYICVDENLQLTIQILTATAYVEKYANGVDIKRNYYLTLFKNNKRYQLTIFLKVCYNTIYNKINDILVIPKDRRETRDYGDLRGVVKVDTDKDYFKDLGMFLPICYNHLINEYKERYIDGN